MCSATESPVFSDRVLSAAITGSGRNMCVRFMHILCLCFHTPVQLVGFGVFDIKERGARIGRNPKTKEEIEIPATRVPVFKAGKVLKDAVSK